MTREERMIWKSHPDYSEGYRDAFNYGLIPEADASLPYCVGNEAGRDARRMFIDSGFEAGDEGVVISLALHGERP